ncbi:MAG: ATPase [Deltaproteobacteria bacterium]|nr:ATPase [Deltaproteobacteria bacterium]
MKFFAGVDVGSSATKAVVIDEQRRVVGRGLHHSGADFEQAAKAAYEQALAEAGLERTQVAMVCSTGYGRSNVDFAGEKRTEIDCHARGAYHYFPRAITVVDIGGQDNKIIVLNENGKRMTFSMNRKCAAGTGSFIEEMSLRLKIPIEQVSELAEKSQDPKVKIGSYCTVFAMTEILSKIRAGVKAEDLARAALESVATRVLESLASAKEVVATGGVVAHNPIMQEMLSRILKTKVNIPPDPQYIGALGAALVAAG